MNFEEFKKEYQYVPVEHYSNSVPNEPMVSVCVQTYQHADYIEKCLDSILMQETDFSFEILLGEDASTDGTREICKKYAEKYPSKIRLFLHHRENNIEIRGKPSGRFNFLYNLYSAKGKYIALCEGDDYWTDLLKLQKQVDFMEENKDYALIHTDHSYKDEETGKVQEARWRKAGKEYKKEKNCAPLLLSDEYYIGTCTALMRTKLVKNILKSYAHDFDVNYMMGDNQLWFHLARMGKIKYLTDITAFYRRHVSGATSFHHLERRLNFIKNVHWQKRSFAKRYGYEEVLPAIDKKYLRHLSILTLRLESEEKTEYISKFKSLKAVDNYDILNLYFWLFVNRFPFLRRIVKKILKR